MKLTKTNKNTRNKSLKKTSFTDIKVKSSIRTNRRTELKQKCVDYLGGKCERCGYNQCIVALEFDHINPALKKFSISQIVREGTGVISDGTDDWEVIKEELDKCRLLCANCHRERHWEDHYKSAP